jgi:hypothetical protein
MPNRTEARPAKAVLTYATGRLPLLRLFSTPLKIHIARPNRWRKLARTPGFDRVENRVPHAGFARGSTR